ncbi:hypothetical protein SAMN05660816_05899 [Niastella yeongjuensis]|nr:hypothetical protein SAMN05660816_05899 [Niastella yeongjuensis]
MTGMDNGIDSDWIRTYSNPFNLRAITKLLQIDSKLLKLKKPFKSNKAIFHDCLFYYWLKSAPVSAYCEYSTVRGCGSNYSNFLDLIKPVKLC